MAAIVQNCKLEPAADEQLHIVIAELMAGAEAMEGKVKGETRRAGAERIAKAERVWRASSPGSAPRLSDIKAFPAAG